MSEQIVKLPKHVDIVETKDEFLIVESRKKETIVIIRKDSIEVEAPNPYDILALEIKRKLTEKINIPLTFF